MPRLSENAVSFFGAGGHKHDGVSSTLISTPSYSLFDFNPGYIGSQSRISIQQTNQTALEDWVMNLVNTKVLAPAGLDLAPGLLSGKSIRANTITAVELQANTITASEIAAGTITANQLSSNIILVNNVIRSNNYNGTIAANGAITATGNAGWAITSFGSAEFSSASIRGVIDADSVTTPGLTIANTGAISSNNFNVTANGDITASNANIAGTITSGAGSIGGWAIGPSAISAGSSALYSNGYLSINSGIIASGVTIGGTAASALVANATLGGSAAQPGSVNGLVTSIDGSTITTGTINLNNLNVRTGTSGARINLDSGGLYAYNAAGTQTVKIGSDGSATFTGSVSGSTISGSTVTTGTWSAAGATGLKLDSDGYITGAGGGVKIRNFGTNGTDGATGTLLFGDVISSPTVRGDKLEVVSRFTAADIGVTISPTSGNTPLELERNYVATANFIRFRNTSNSTYPGAIEFNGTNGLTYKTTSDKRLKENIEEIINACSIVKKLSPVEFNFISDGPSLKMHGFLAQDMYEVYTYPVSVGSDDVEENPWGIDYGKITPLLTAALKEALERIESLEARIQNLEGV
jgi:hypothetical protein